MSPEQARGEGLDGRRPLQPGAPAARAAHGPAALPGGDHRRDPVRRSPRGTEGAAAWLRHSTGPRPDRGPLPREGARARVWPERLARRIRRARAPGPAPRGRGGPPRSARPRRSAPRGVGDPGRRSPGSSPPAPRTRTSPADAETDGDRRVRVGCDQEGSGARGPGLVERTYVVGDPPVSESDRYVAGLVDLLLVDGELPRDVEVVAVVVARLGFSGDHRAVVAYRQLEVPVAPESPAAGGPALEGGPNLPAIAWRGRCGTGLRAGAGRSGARPSGRQLSDQRRSPPSRRPLPRRDAAPPASRRTAVATRRSGVSGRPCAGVSSWTVPIGV